MLLAIANGVVTPTVRTLGCCRSHAAARTHTLTAALSPSSLRRSRRMLVLAGRLQTARRWHDAFHACTRALESALDADQSGNTAIAGEHCRTAADFVALAHKQRGFLALAASDDASQGGRAQVQWVERAQRDFSFALDLAPPDAPQSERADVLFGQASALVRTRSHQQALDLLAQVLQLDASYAPAHHKRAECFQLMGMIERVAVFVVGCRLSLLAFIGSLGALFVKKLRMKLIHKHGFLRRNFREGFGTSLK